MNNSSVLSSMSCSWVEITSKSLLFCAQARHESAINIELFFSILQTRHRHIFLASSHTRKFIIFSCIDIKSLSGEPNYRSVNLTWEIEEVAHQEPTISAQTPAFTVFYCEMQAWGAHRCKSKILQDNEIDGSRQKRQYSMVIDNLRMATKYTFHVKEQKAPESRGPSARADFSDENSLDDQASIRGQTIIIPTKGCK